MLWDIFCKVIDNHGDLGVCWRLSADLASRGEQVRLWVDEPAALGWMAPHGHASVQVKPWTRPLGPTELTPCDALVEAFGCEIPDEFLVAREGQGQPPVWINLEYLSAESYVERCHGLPSPVMSGPAAGRVKWFFYPGLTSRTGGLLRETDLLPRQARWRREAWQKELWPRLVHVGSRATPASSPPPFDERWISLFCYEPEALGALLTSLQRGPIKTRLLVTPGRAAAAVKAVLERPNVQQDAGAPSALSISYLPLLSQREFDELLWGCELNFVRGEDSLVRAIWAGRPFVWQIYPQVDGAHLIKLEAMLDLLGAPDTLRQFHRTWNASSADAAPLPEPGSDLQAWQACAEAARSHCLAQIDLANRLLNFVREKR